MQKEVLTPEILDDLLSKSPGYLWLDELRKVYRWGRSLKPILAASPNVLRRDNQLFDRRQLPTKVRASLAQAQSEHGIRQPRSIEGLTAETKIGTDRGIKFYYVIFRENGQIVWKIVPTITHNHRVQSYRLLHRNKFGNTKSYHVQHREWGNKKGFRRLIQAIIDHRAIEAERGW